MRIGAIDDALALILDWAGQDKALPPSAPCPGLPAALPRVISVSDALGPGFSSSDSQNRPLRSVQDQIWRPEDMQPDDDGILPLVTENQCVWRLGFAPSAPEQVLVTGDWLYGDDDLHPDRWCPLSMTCEDALILTVLVNGFFGLGTRFETREEPDFEIRPADCPVLLWTHAALAPGWTGFWTDDASQRLHFGGFGQTLIRA